MWHTVRSVCEWGAGAYRVEQYPPHTQHTSQVSQLDKNLEQLTVMYHKLVSQNSGLKVECQVNEKKVQRKDARIQSLEKSVREAKSKYEKLLNQCANLTAAMDLMGRTKTSIVRRAPNIVRPLKGGRNSAASQSGTAGGGSLAGGGPGGEEDGAEGAAATSGAGGEMRVLGPAKRTGFDVGK